MSRADKTQTQITYDLYFDETNTVLRQLVVTVLCATRSESGGSQGAGALTTASHVAFFSRYRFSREEQVERFEIPSEAAPLLR